MAPSDADKTFLSVRELAELLALDRKTVRRAIRRGTLRAIRLGPRGDFRIPASEVERLLGAGASEGRRP